MSTTHPAKQFACRSCGMISRHARHVTAIAHECLEGRDLEQFLEDWPHVLSGHASAYVAISLPHPSGPFRTDGPVCGFLVLRVFGETVAIRSQAVAHEYRRCGVGAHLLGHAKSKLRGIRRSAFAMVGERNLAMQLCLRSEGFRWTETLPDPWGEGQDRYSLDFRRGIEDVLLAKGER